MILHVCVDWGGAAGQGFGGPTPMPGSGGGEDVGLDVCLLAGAGTLERDHRERTDGSGLVR